MSLLCMKDICKSFNGSRPEAGTADDRKGKSMRCWEKMVPEINVDEHSCRCLSGRQRRS